MNFASFTFTASVLATAIFASNAGAAGDTHGTHHPSLRLSTGVFH